MDGYTALVRNWCGLHPLEAVIPEKELRTGNNKKKVCQVVSVEHEDYLLQEHRGAAIAVNRD